MNAANLDKSKRLQRALEYLKTDNCSPKSTRDLIYNANICAVNAVIPELRLNGYNITCNRRGDYYYYKLEG